MLLFYNYHYHYRFPQLHLGSKQSRACAVSSMWYSYNGNAIVKYSIVPTSAVTFEPHCELCVSLNVCLSTPCTISGALKVYLCKGYHVLSP